MELGSHSGGGPSLEERCAAVAKEYSLSPRELEVLILLARGRNVSYIQDQLGIAHGTVKAHTRHIYSKLGVRSKQELNDLVDSAASSS